MKPILIDRFIYEEKLHNVSAQINNNWYIAKPLGSPPLLTKLKHCLLVLRGKGFVCQYAEDYFKD